jgi:hypothetical protein
MLEGRVDEFALEEALPGTFFWRYTDIGSKTGQRRFETALLYLQAQSKGYHLWAAVINSHAKYY